MLKPLFGPFFSRPECGPRSRLEQPTDHNMAHDPVQAAFKQKRVFVNIVVTVLKERLRPQSESYLRGKIREAPFWFLFRVLEMAPEMGP